MAGDGVEPEGTELSDCDVLDDGEDSEPAAESHSRLELQAVRNE